MSDFFLIGSILSPYGKDGAVKISSFSDQPDRFVKLKKVYIDFFGDKKEFLIEKVSEHKEFLSVKFKNFDSAEDAEVLAGKNIFVDDQGIIKLPEGTYFVHDVIGSRVYRNNKEFGTLTDVLNYPANDVYVIEDTEGKEILIPAVKDFIKSYDPDKKILVLTPGDEFYENDED